jgi:TolB-like protein
MQLQNVKHLLLNQIINFMKTKLIILLIAINFTVISHLSAQSINNHQSIAVMNIDAYGFSLDPTQMRNLVYIELLKLKLYEVIDGNEIDFLMKENQINLNSCYNASCLIEVGGKLGADKMLTGKVEVLGEKILINFRLIDVKMERMVVNEVWEFLNLPDEIQTMVKLALQKMFNKKVDEELMDKLSKGLAFDIETYMFSSIKH